MNKLVDIITADAEKMIKNVDLSPLENKTIMVTGASGIVGVYFLSSLNRLAKIKKIRFKLVAIMQAPPVQYLKEILDFDSVQILLGDITDFQFLSSLPAADYIIHAAGYAQPNRFMENPEKTIKVNTFSLFTLFEKLRPSGKFLFISSSELYSGLKNPPFTEDQIGTTNTTHPRSCYIESKRCGEAICHAQRGKGVDVKSARLSLVYGPGTRLGDTRALNSFIEKAFNGKLKLNDFGLSLRTYCYISDAVETLWQILLYGKEPIYNVAGKSKVTIKELAHLIGDTLKVPVELPMTNAMLPGSPDNVELDLSKIFQEFKKEEYLDFHEGLSRTIEWQKELYGIG